MIHVNSHLEITVRTEFLVLDKRVGNSQEEVCFSFMKLSVLQHLIQAVVRQMGGVFPAKPFLLQKGLSNKIIFVVCYVELHSVGWMDFFAWDAASDTFW